MVVYGNKAITPDHTQSIPMFYDFVILIQVFFHQAIKLLLENVTGQNLALYD